MLEPQADVSLTYRGPAHRPQCPKRASSTVLTSARHFRCHPAFAGLASSLYSSWGVRNDRERCGRAELGDGEPPRPPNPLRWRLQAFAFGPMSTRLSRRRLNHDIRFKPVRPGPIGELINVVDYNGSPHPATGLAAGQQRQQAARGHRRRRYLRKATSLDGFAASCRGLAPEPGRPVFRELAGAFPPRPMLAVPFRFSPGRYSPRLLALSDGGLSDNMADKWLLDYMECGEVSLQGGGGEGLGIEEGARG